MICKVIFNKFFFIIILLCNYMKKIKTDSLFEDYGIFDTFRE